jgi:glycogen operon protein
MQGIHSPDWADRTCLGTEPCCNSIRGLRLGATDRSNPLRDSIIYELHVRGFTRHPSAKVGHPGTFKGVSEKISYLKRLGVTAVELMPVTEFNENETTFTNPWTGERLKNFWGYSPLSFFAPKCGYSSDLEAPLSEFRDMVKALHRGMRSFSTRLNHPAESSATVPTTSFRGIDNTNYYLPTWTPPNSLSGCATTAHNARSP